MKKLRSLPLLFILSVALAAPGYAQKVDHDPRPREMPDVRPIPSYGSVPAFLAEHESSSLHDAAISIGRASVRALPGREDIPPTLGRAANKNAPTFELPALNVRRAPNGTVRWMNGELGRVEASKRGADPVEAALGILDEHADVLRLREPARELRNIDISVDELGFTHARFEQTYEGVPVWGRDLYVHFDAKDDVYAINGTYEPTPVDVDLETTLTSSAAHDAVVRDLQTRGQWAPLPEDAASAFGIDRVDTRQVLYPLDDGQMSVAYEVNLHPNLIEWYTYVVDARDGSILNRIQRHCTLHYDPDASPAATDVDGLANVASVPTASGSFHSAQAVDLNGVTQSLRVYQHTNDLFYKIWDLPNYSASGSTMPNEPAGGAITISANNRDLQQGVELMHVTSSNNSWSDPAAVSAHYNMRVAYDYFRDVHGRKAIDDNDQSLISIIHITENGQQVDNAYWNGRMMIYGNGSRVFKPLAGSLDTGGHEMSHGVIQHTANLVYQFQPGALNESFADVFGVLIDPDNMLLGETIMQPGQGIALRDLLNPDNPQVNAPQPAHMNEFRQLTIDQDNGGVHVNSGIPNRAAALIMQAIGHDKTGDIYYRALSSYLTRNSEFEDARNAIEQATRDLFGEGAELAAVQAAFDAVGIGGGTGNGGDDTTVPVLVGGQSLIAFMVDDGRIGTVDMSSPDDAQPRLFDHAGAVARVAHQTGDRSQLTTGRSGQRIWYVNAQGQLANLDVRTGEVSVFQDLYLYEPGDIWNASISPGEDYVALVSAYLGDPTIYIFDGESLGAIALEPETTQSSIKAATIEYPDVITWSPDPSDPRLVFDAYNSGGAGLGLLLNYWSLYELDLASSKVFNLLPAQPSNLSVGNVAYSSTSAQTIAFNVIDNTYGIHDVVLGDFATGEMRFLDMPSITVNGNPVYDAQRPTFSPDDGTICIATPAHGLLLFVDLSTNDLGYLNPGVPLFHPHWFVLDGQSATGTDELVEPVASVALHPNYPNPFSGSTTIRFELADPVVTEVAVYDLLGRRVATVADGPRASGSHEVHIDAQSLSSGIYFVRLTAGQETRHRQIIVTQ